jgi:hypothetical protein
MAPCVVPRTQSQQILMNKEAIDLRDDEGDWPVGEAFKGESTNNEGTATGGAVEAFYNEAEDGDENF